MEKTKMCRRGLKRLLAFLLSALCMLGVLPLSAFAMEPGQTASSWLGDQYVGSDGQHYYSPAPYTYLVYNSDGTMDVRTSPAAALTATICLPFPMEAAIRFIVWRAGFPIIPLIIPIHQRAGRTANT